MQRLLAYNPLQARQDVVYLVGCVSRVLLFNTRPLGTENAYWDRLNYLEFFHSLVKRVVAEHVAAHYALLTVPVTAGEVVQHMLVVFGTAGHQHVIQVLKRDTVGRAIVAVHVHHPFYLGPPMLHKPQATAAPSPEASRDFAARQRICVLP